MGLKPHEIAKLGLVRTFQKTSVFRGNSVFENVLIGLHRSRALHVVGYLLSLPRESRERELVHEADEILQFVGLAQRATELAAPCHTASSGCWAGAGAGGEAEDAAARRAGVRDECVRDRAVS